MTGTGIRATNPPADQPDERINLIVLFGGESAEHDVSCTTAAHVLAAADTDKYRITPVGISTGGRWAVATSALDALESGQDALPGRLDPDGTEVSPTALLSAAATEPSTTVVMPLLHGPMGEDGTVQGLVELANLPYVGAGVLASAVAMDKAMAKQVLAAAGIPQARSRSFAEHDLTPSLPDDIVEELGLPVFVKPANMGSSVGVSKARTIDEVRDAIDVALSYDEWIVVEEAITGKEIEVAVLGNLEPQAATPGEIVPGDDFYSYDDKYVSDQSYALIPAPIGDAALAEARELAIRTYRALRCEGLARVDFFWEDPADHTGRGRGFLCNEVNTMPGFTPISMFPKMWISDGVSYPEIIDRLVELAIERHGRRRRNTKH
ncbi:D-alanine--D-alanine ligase family protein [Ilumatobacter nonamiensis]|uniref:D-alanine--D-alanine ligase family protein n=1 Tax=Ilumatobacter nonamiensis TaxID=467093 RepID=UPI0006840698|nr:D-alanine--D-alanine ligase family protein [Ilumatobacter nonamiensis]